MTNGVSEVGWTVKDYGTEWLLCAGRGVNRRFASEEALVAERRADEVGTPTPAIDAGAWRRETARRPGVIALADGAFFGFEFGEMLAAHGLSGKDGSRWADRETGPLQAA